MRDEPTMSLFCLSGVNASDGQTHVQLCLGAEDDKATSAPYFLTITIAGESGEEQSQDEAQHHRLPLKRGEIENLRRWLDQVLAER